MPRQRDLQEHTATAEAIKAAARAQMRAEGSAALSLRAIARALDVTAPALYSYFPNREALITALVVDGFSALAEAMEAADAALPHSDYRGRLAAVYRAYRAFALAHPFDFQLIYGNPIPGYEAPPEVTVPAVQRGFRVAGRIVVQAWQAGAYQPHFGVLPATVDAALQPLVAAEHISAPPEMLYALFAGWTKIHGMVILELMGHLKGTVGDLPAFFEHELARLLTELGFP